MIKKCKCEHQSQDKIHGEKNRVFNECADGYKCTVCGALVKSVTPKPKQ